MLKFTAPLLLITLLLGTQFMISSCSSSLKQSNKPNILVVGHRGTRGYMPENTWPSFEKSLEMGVDAIEMDVTVTKDKELLVSHDPFAVSEICLDPQGKKIPEADQKKHNFYKMSYGEIQAYDCGTKPHPRFPLQQKFKITKPLLSEVITKGEAWGKAHNKELRYYIEIKSVKEEDNIFQPDAKEFARLSYEAFKSLGILNKMLVLSFDERILQELKILDPKLPLDFLVENQNGVEKNLALLGFNPDVYGVDYNLLSQNDVDYLHSKKIQVAPWTLNEISEIKKMVELGVDSITTDYPDRVFSVLNKGL